MKAVFPNLEAEKARNDITDDDIAMQLGMSRNTFAKKKNEKRLSISEIRVILSLFNATFEYLFYDPPEQKGA